MATIGIIFVVWLVGGALGGLVLGRAFRLSSGEGSGR